VLVEHDLLRGEPSPPEHRFLATGDQAPFTRLAQRFLGPTVPPTGFEPAPPFADAGVAR
jgi:glutamate racemase